MITQNYVIWCSFIQDYLQLASMIERLLILNHTFLFQRAFNEHHRSSCRDEENFIIVLLDNLAFKFPIITKLRIWHFKNFIEHNQYLKSGVALAHCHVLYHQQAQSIKKKNSFLHFSWTYILCFLDLGSYSVYKGISIW